MSIRIRIRISDRRLQISGPMWVQFGDSGRELLGFLRVPEPPVRSIAPAVFGGIARCVKLLGPVGVIGFRARQPKAHGPITNSSAGHAEFGTLVTRPTFVSRFQLVAGHHHPSVTLAAFVAPTLIPPPYLDFPHQTTCEFSAQSSLISLSLPRSKPVCCATLGHTSFPEIL
jgi:hypothetical protein